MEKNEKIYLKVKFPFRPSVPAIAGRTNISFRDSGVTYWEILRHNGLCGVMGNRWGYGHTARALKKVRNVLQLCVRASGRNAHFTPRNDVVPPAHRHTDSKTAALAQMARNDQIFAFIRRLIVMAFSFCQHRQPTHPPTQEFTLSGNCT